MRRWPIPEQAMQVTLGSAVQQRIAAAAELAARDALGEALALLADLPHELPSLWRTRAMLHRELGDVAASRRAWSRSATAGGGDLARLRRALTVAPIAPSSMAIDAWRTRIGRELSALSRRPLSLGDPSGEHSSLDFYFAYHGRADLPLRRTLAALVGRAMPWLGDVRPAPAPPLDGRPLRVGFVSSHLRDHTIGLLNRGLIEALPCFGVEPVVVFVGETGPDPVAAALSAAASSLVVPRSLRPAAAAIAALRLDVLVHTDLGMDAFTWFLATGRLARRQCVTWGHPVTSGLPTIDDYLASETMLSETAVADLLEHPIALPDPGVVVARPEPPPACSRQDLGLPAEARLYLCPQSAFKLHPDFDRVLGAILQRDPRGVVVLLQPLRQAWRETLVARMRAHLDVDRLHFVPILPRPRFRGLLALGDVMLDPPTFGGGHTTLEALAVGTPIVTLPSPFLKGRLTAAFYAALGIDDAIATSEVDYVERAVRLATDAAANTTLRHRIVARADRLFGRTDVAEALAAAFGARGRLVSRRA